MSRTWISLCALILLSALVALFWESEEGVQSEAASTDSGSATEPVEASAEIASVADLVAATHARQQSAAASLLASPSTIRPPYAGDDGILVHLIDARTTQPVPHAEVFWLDQADMDRNGWQLISPAGITGMVRLVREHGGHYRSDEAGIVRLPRAVESASLLAESDGLLGFEMRVSIPSGDLRLRMMTEQKMVVTVLDSAGQAVPQAPVSMQAHVNSRVNTLSTLVTGPAGTATFEGKSMAGKWGGPQAKKVITLGIPTDTASAAKFASVELNEPVYAAGHATLIMPETGLVRITVLDELGEIYPASGTVQLVAYEGEKHYPTSRLIEPTVDGVAEFKFVGLGGQLKAIFHHQRSANADEIIFAGPTEEGLRVEAELVHANWPYLTGVLIDPDGNPVVERKIDLRQIDLHGKHSSTVARPELRTDADGYFRVEPKEISYLGQPLSRSLKLHMDLESFGPCQTEMEIPVDLPPGPTDLGEIHLIRNRVLLAGRVLDDLGEPILGAEVEVQCTASDQADGGWSSKVRKQDRSDARGLFEVVGKLPQASAYFVEIHAQGFEAWKEEITPGMIDVDYRLKKAGVLIGTVLLDQEIEPMSLRVVLKNGDHYDSVPLIPFGEPNSYQLRFEGRANVPYSLEVRTSSLEALLYLEDLVMVAGQETRPPELQPLDLRGLLHDSTIEVRNAAGTAIAAKFSIQKGNRNKQVSSAEGMVSFLHSKPIDQIEIRAAGYAGQTLREIEGNQIVALEQALEIVVEIPPDLANLRGTELAVQVSSAEPDAAPERGNQSYKFDASGHSKLFVPHPGSYQFELKVRRRMGLRTISSRVNRSTQSVTRAGQTIILVVEQAELDRKIDTLLKRE
jgi:hypothetical protein